MAEAHNRMALPNPGDCVELPAQPFTVTLRWSGGVDLDLMAFYRTKTGQTGGVLSEHFPCGGLGCLEEFPFICLNGDAHTIAPGMVKEEVLQIARLEEMEEVYIAALNYTDASQDRKTEFAALHGLVQVTDPCGKSIEVPLDSTQPGHAAVICKIVNTDPAHPQLINMNAVMDLDAFYSTIPGALLVAAG